MPMTPKGSRLTLLTAVCVLVTLSLAVWMGWPHIRFWWRFESVGLNAQGYPEYRHRQTSIVMVKLPGGTFLMGTSKEEADRYVEELVKGWGENRRKEIEDWISAEQPQHRVTLSPFLISKFEVRQVEWERVMSRNPSEFKAGNLPVENVFRDDYQEFFQKTGLMLPTEAQWEYACRGGMKGPYDASGGLDAIGWYMMNSGKKTHPVGQKKPNAFGLHDMHGNVWEWCEDIFDKSFYSKPEASFLDPVATSGGNQVFRGGSWETTAEYCRSAYRYTLYPDYRFGIIGFRPAHPWPF